MKEKTMAANDNLYVALNPGLFGTNNATNTYFRNTLTDNVKVTPAMVNEAVNKNVGKGLAGTVFDKTYGKGFQAGANSTTPKTGWFGKGGYIDTGANVFNALSGVANAYTGYKSLGLAQDEFKFNKGLASTNLANQASLINEQRLKAAKVGNALAGGTMTTAQKQNYLNDIKAGNVSGTI